MADDGGGGAESCSGCWDGVSSGPAAAAGLELLTKVMVSMLGTVTAVCPPVYTKTHSQPRAHK